MDNYASITIRVTQRIVGTFTVNVAQAGSISNVPPIGQVRALVDASSPASGCIATPISTSNGIGGLLWVKFIICTS